MKTIAQVREALESRKDRSAWNRGVTQYAIMLLDDLTENRSIDASHAGKEIEYTLDPATIINELLNGASSWYQYSWGGSALIYDEDIAAALCTPSELARTKHGERRPNAREEWLDVQARALRRAAFRIKAAAEGRATL